MRPGGHAASSPAHPRRAWPSRRDDRGKFGVPSATRELAALSVSAGVFDDAAHAVGVLGLVLGGVGAGAGQRAA